MCTPVGHAVLGSALCVRMNAFESMHWTWRLLIIIVMANLPDIDFVFGAVQGNPNAYHHLWTHSLMFVLLIGGGLGWTFSRMIHSEMNRMVPLFILLILSHIVLDFLAVDRSPPYGMPIFWPFSKESFLSPITPFRDVIRASNTRAFLPRLFSLHNLWTVLKELGCLIPVLAWAMIWDRKHRHVVKKRRIDEKVSSCSEHEAGPEDR